MDSAPNPNPLNMAATAQDSSHVNQIGQIHAQNLYISGEPAAELLDRLDRSGQEPGAGILQGGDTPVTLTFYQPRPDPEQCLRQWIADENVTLIGIEGMGGTGKSTLAARLYWEKNATLPQRRYWADCSQGGTFAEVGRNLLQAFGARVPEQDIAKQVVRCLRQGAALVILDNLESLLDEAGQWRSEDYGHFFEQWQSSGGTSTLLLTTRERPLWKGWLGLEWLTLAGFTTAEGVAFLQDLGIGGDLPPFVELVGGHPLLLRLVGALLKEEYPQNPDLGQLQHLGLGNLKDLITDDQVRGPHRRETIGLALVLDASFQRLSAPEQSLLTSLCALGSTFDPVTAWAMNPEPMEGLWSNQLQTIQQTLRQLHRKSWLEQTLAPTSYQPIYTFQPVVQEYLRHRATDLRAAHQRAINHYQATLTPRPWHNLEALDPHRNLFYHHFQQGNWDAAFDTLREFDDFLTLQGYPSLRVNLYGQLVSAYQHQDDRTNWKYRASLTDLGNAYYSLGEYGKAIDFHQQHLDIARAIGDRKGEATSLSNLGIAYQSLGEYEKAINLHKQSLDIARINGFPECEINACGALGDAHQSLGKYGQAIEFHQQCLDLARANNDPKKEANSYCGLGNDYYHIGEYEKAIDFHQQSLAISKAIGDRQGEANSYGGLGNAYQSLGEYGKAIDFHQQHLDIARAIGDRQGEAASLGNLGNAYYALEKYEKAIEFHQKSLEIAKSIGDRKGEANSYGGLGNAYQSLGEYGKAIDFHQQSLEIKKAIGDRKGEAYACFNLGLALSKVNRSEDALDAFRNARELFAGMGLQSDLQDCENKIQELTQSLASSQKRSKPNFFQWIGRSFRH